MFIQKKQSRKGLRLQNAFEFKTSVTYKKRSNFLPNYCVRYEAASVEHNSIFPGHCLMSSANI